MNDLVIIEKLLIEKGRVVDYADLSVEYAYLSNIAQKVSSLIEKGFLVKLRKGKYYISKLGSLGFTSISSFSLANIIGEESFVSFEAALKYHGLFDQGLKKYRSISKKQYLSKEIEGIKYTYVKVKNEDFFGFEEERMDDRNVKIATKERALVDLIEYHRTIHTISLVIEKLNEYKNEIDYSLLFDYLDKHSQTTLKTFGLIFDWIGLDSAIIESKVNSHKSTHKLLESSDIFNEKWRIYYNSILKEQLK